MKDKNIQIIKFKFTGETKIGACKNGNPFLFSPLHESGKVVMIPELLKNFLIKDELYYITGSMRDYNDYFVFVPENMGLIKKIISKMDDYCDKNSEKKKTFFNLLS